MELLTTSSTLLITLFLHPGLRPAKWPKKTLWRMLDSFAVWMRSVWVCCERLLWDWLPVSALGRWRNSRQHPLLDEDSTDNYLCFHIRLSKTLSSLQQHQKKSLDLSLLSIKVVRRVWKVARSSEKVAEFIRKRDLNYWDQLSKLKLYSLERRRER